MTKFYLEFEKPLKVIDEKIISFSSITDLKHDDISSLSKLKEERTLLIREIYSGLSRWQRIQLARHPNRPFSMDYINYLCPEFIFRTDSIIDIWLNIGFTILWLVTLTNAFNFIDSSDGLLVGLGGLSTTFFLVIAMSNGQEPIIYFCAILLGLCIGLYFFNSYPAKLFLGDSGAQTLGFILGAIAIVYNPNTGFQSSSWFLPIMIFYVPLFDLALVIFSRLRRKKPIHQASMDHTYHRLSKRGISINHSVLVLHGVSLIMSMIGYLCLNLPVIYANLVFCLTILLAIAIFFKLDNNF